MGGSGPPKGYTRCGWPRAASVPPFEPSKKVALRENHGMVWVEILGMGVRPRWNR